MSGVTSLVERYNAQMAKCRQQLQGGLRDVCLPLEKVTEYTAIYNHATNVIQALLKEPKPDNTRLQDELSAAQAEIQTLIELRAKDKLEFETNIKAKQDGFTQLNDQLQAAYAQIQHMIKVQNLYNAAIDKLREIINNQKEYYTTAEQTDSVMDAQIFETLRNDIARLTEKLNNKSA